MVYKLQKGSSKLTREKKWHLDQQTAARDLICLRSGDFKMIKRSIHYVKGEMQDNNLYERT